MLQLDRPLFHWYVDSPVGKELVIALYTLPCRYARCAFCSLPSLAAGGDRVSPANLESQIDHVMAQYSAEQLSQVAKVSVYTAASALDQVCLPTRSLMYLMLAIVDLPSLSVVSLETRAEYVEEWELEAVKAVLGPRVKVEIAIGYETHDPHLRNKILGKGLSSRGLLWLVRRLADHDVALKAYLMLKPHHTLSEETGVEEAARGLAELAGLRDEHKVPVSIHLNPTYVARGCRLAAELSAHGYEPPELSSVLRVVERAHELRLPIYVGLEDEGLALDGGTFRSTGLDRAHVSLCLKKFNRHQDCARLLAEVRASAA